MFSTMHGYYSDKNDIPVRYFLWQISSNSDYAVDTGFKIRSGITDKEMLIQ